MFVNCNYCVHINDENLIKCESCQFNPSLELEDNFEYDYDNKGYIFEEWCQNHGIDFSESDKTKNKFLKDVKNGKL